MSKRWQEVRKAVYARDGGICVHCQDPYYLHVHHLTYDHRGDEINHLENLVLLCRRCHMKQHSNFQFSRKPRDCFMCGDGTFYELCNDCIKAGRDCGYDLSVEIRTGPGGLWEDTGRGFLIYTSPAPVRVRLVFTPL